MDSSANPKPTGPEAHPPAVVQPGSAAEHSGAAPTESTMDIDSMLNKPGFAAFLENAKDADSFEVTEDNKEAVAERFRAFEASKTLARQLETAMNQKLQAEGRGRINLAERRAFEKHVADLVANEPEKLFELQKELRVLEENPEKIRAKEVELLHLKESWDADKVKADIAELSAERAKTEQLLKEAKSINFSRLQRLFFYNFGARLGAGKVAENVGEKARLDAELKEMDATIKEAETALKLSPEIQENAERAIREVQERLDSAREEIFASNEVAQMIRERLISETSDRLEKALESTDIGTLEKAAEQFTADKKQADEGSDYLGPANTDEFSRAYKEAWNEQMKTVIGVGILDALESVPPSATLERVERALKKFTELVGKEVGFMDKDEAREFVLDVLRTAERTALKNAKGSGKSIMLKRLIAKLSKGDSS